MTPAVAQSLDPFKVGRAFMLEAAARMDVSVPPPHLLYDTPGYPTTIRAITVAAIRRLSVTAELLKPAAVGEAAVLARSLIESAASTAYIGAPTETAERERRSLRFRTYEVVQVQTHLDQALRCLSTGSGDTDLGRRLLAAANLNRRTRDQALARFDDLEKKFKRGWAGDGFGGMLRDVLARDPRARVGMLADWYVRFSAYTHSTALSTSLTLSAEESQERTSLAFHVACASVLAVLACCIESARFNPHHVPTISSLMDRSMIAMCRPEDAESRAVLAWLRWY